MFLGFDIGNTSTVIGLYDRNSVAPVRTGRYKTGKRMKPEKLAGNILAFLGEDTQAFITGAAFSSVVPEINKTYHRVLMNEFSVKSLEISHSCSLGITINYTDPGELGVDRIVNAVAAHSEYSGNLIIIDIGTAATFCVMLANGEFDGGLIAPGIGTTIKALARRASNLPEIIFEKPDRLVARDTENALKSGFFYGWAGLIDGIIDRIVDEYGSDFRILLSGGYAEIISRNIRHENTVDTLLTMKGIKYIYDLNRGGSSPAAART